MGESIVVSFVPHITNREILQYFFERAGQRISKQRIVDYFVCERVQRFPRATCALYRYIKQQVASQFENIELGNLPGITMHNPIHTAVVVPLFPKRKLFWLRLHNKFTRIG